jgi:hypothetical protein
MNVTKVIAVVAFGALVAMGTYTLLGSLFKQANAQEMPVENKLTDEELSRMKPNQVPVMCGPSEVVVKLIEQVQKESVQSLGTVGSGKYVAKLYASEDGTTWTFAMVSTDGVVCVFIWGNDWTNVQ